MRPPLEHSAPDRRPLSEQPKWRKDFPIEVADDEYVSRRDFAKFLVLTSAAMATGQIALVAQSVLNDVESAEPLAIIQDQDVDRNSVVAFHYPTHADPCLLCRLEDGRLLAFGQLCPHLLCPVIPDLEQSKFICPCHKGSFDMESGRPLAGPPRRPLPRVNLEVRQDGMIYAVGLEFMS